MRLLIVENHPIVRRGLKDIFAEAFPELQVAEAEDSQAALELLMKQQWDLVLLAVNIPGRGGVEVLADAKSLQARTPVLVLSAYPEEEFAVRLLKLGASGYLNKRVATDEILAAAKKALAGGKYVTAAFAEILAASLASDVEQNPHESLSSRELQVLRMVANAKIIKEIAAEFALSEKTVSTYRMRVARKLGLNSNVKLTRYALKHRLVDQLALSGASRLSCLSGNDLTGRFLPIGRTFEFSTFWRTGLSWGPFPQRKGRLPHR